MLLYSLRNLFGYGSRRRDQEVRHLHSKTGPPEYGDNPASRHHRTLGQGSATRRCARGKATRCARPRRRGPGPAPRFVGRQRRRPDGRPPTGPPCRQRKSTYWWALRRQPRDPRGPHRGLSEDVPARFRAQGWHVESIDGEDVAALDRALAAAYAAGKPALLAMRTTIGRGSPWAGQSKVHGGPFGPEALAATKQKLGIPESPTFLVPDAVRGYCAERAAAKREERKAFDARLAAWRGAHADAAKSWEAVRSRTVPADFADKLADGLEGKADATRKHSGTALGRIAALAPASDRGSADLAGSNQHHRLEHRHDRQGDDPFAGGNALRRARARDGGDHQRHRARRHVPAYAGTFPVFSDYCGRAPARGAASRALHLRPSPHDSISWGGRADAQRSSSSTRLRAIPGLTVIRPADAVEARWRGRGSSRSARAGGAGADAQTVPARSASAAHRRGVARGAYGCATRRRARLVLVASGPRCRWRARRRRCCRATASRRAWSPRQPRAARRAAGGLSRRLLPRRPARGRRAGRGERWRGTSAARASSGIALGASAPYKKPPSTSASRPKPWRRRPRAPSQLAVTNAPAARFCPACSRWRLDARDAALRAACATARATARCTSRRSGFAPARSGRRGSDRARGGHVISREMRAYARVERGGRMREAEQVFTERPSARRRAPASAAAARSRGADGEPKTP